MSVLRRILLKRRRVLLVAPGPKTRESRLIFLAHLFRLGYVVENPELYSDSLLESYSELMEELESLRGSKDTFVPLYADFPDQVQPPVRKERCRRLSELERELAMDYYRSQEGSELEVLVERVSDRSPNSVRGTDRRYVPVELPGTIDDVGQFVVARGAAGHQEYLQASRVTQDSL